MIPPCLTLSNIRYVSRVKWSNQGKGVVPSPTPRCCSYWKESLLVALDYSCQLYLLLHSDPVANLYVNDPIILMRTVLGEKCLNWILLSYYKVLLLLGMYLNPFLTVAVGKIAGMNGFSSHGGELTVEKNNSKMGNHSPISSKNRWTKNGNSVNEKISKVFKEHITFHSYCKAL